MDKSSKSTFLIIPLISVVILILTVAQDVEEPDSTPDINNEGNLQRIQEILHAINMTAVENTAAIAEVSQKLEEISASLNAQFLELQNEVKDLMEKVTNFDSAIAQNTAEIAETNMNIGKLDSSLTAVMRQTVKLQSVDQLWLRNFKIINKKFENLGKRSIVVRGG